MNLDVIKNALLTVTNKVYHYMAFKQTGSYIVWAEDTQAESVWADDRMQEQSIQGTVDYYTKTENDPAWRQIQEALSDARVSWRLNSIQYEQETKYIHYEWVWELWLE